MTTERRDPARIARTVTDVAAVAAFGGILAGLIALPAAGTAGVAAPSVTAPATTAPAAPTPAPEQAAPIEAPQAAPPAPAPAPAAPAPVDATTRGSGG